MTTSLRFALLPYCTGVWPRLSWHQGVDPAPDNPDLSIGTVIPVHNNAGTLRDTVSRIRRQMHPQDRIAIIENGSTDDTVEALQDFSDDPQIAILHRKEGDAAAARNAGVAALQGCAYIAFCDGDDEWASDKMAILRSVIEACSPDILWHPALSVLKPGLMEQAGFTRKKLPWRSDFLADLVIVGNFLATSTLVVKSTAIPKPLFADGLTTTQDYEAWCRFALFYRHPRVAYIDAPLSHYRWMGGLSRDAWTRAVHAYYIQRSYGLSLSRTDRLIGRVLGELRILRAAWKSGHLRDFFRVSGTAPDPRFFRGGVTSDSTNGG